ncbi:ChrR family anti-sigma-E factor [Hoeflea sp. YIM 152468]|uniref:ChrR family anti-sigma-E factor n=1 Tax=Hoeflea sp. YIM 152468 TaxID=3031759 RepID=UPI0023DC724A|nr:ChrR family anti-sigma-E factor [Hoeflea sp. YIM 152468]MDF1609862.1 ChrR family anti-sigma-E factor [Hoeflea sp. YIM 152468]
MVREHIDTIDSLLARYVAGTLPTPARVLVEAHLELKPKNLIRVRNLEAMAGLELMDIDPAPLTDRDAMLAAVFDSSAPESVAKSVAAAPDDHGRVFPKALYDFVGFDAADVPWRTRMPGFKEYELGDIEGCHVNLFWIKPGRTVPAHTHEGSELSLVLDGAFSDSRGHYGRGDISVADDSVDHRPVADKGQPCIGFAVMDAPLKLTGSLRQLIGDIIG